MEEYKKIILLDDDFKEIDSKQGVMNFKASFKDIAYESILEGKGSYHGIKGYYIVVPESHEYNEYIEELDVIRFYADMYMDKLSQECNEIIESGFEYKGDKFSYDSKDQSNFNEQLLLLTFDDEEEVEWKTENDGYKTFAKDDFIEICKEGKRNKSSLKKSFNLIKDRVYQITDIKELFDIKDFATELEKIKQ